MKMIEVDDFTLDSLHRDAEQCLKKAESVEDEDFKQHIENLCCASMMLIEAIRKQSFANPLPILSEQLSQILSDSTCSEYERGLRSGIRIAKSAIDSLNTFIETTVGEEGEDNYEEDI